MQVSLRSPHSFLYVEVEDADGSLERWVLEGAGATQFAQQGIDKDAFKIGDPGGSGRQPVAQSQQHAGPPDQNHANHRRQVVGHPYRRGRELTRAGV